MSRRFIVPVVVVCAVAVVLIAGMQGPVVFGQPRFDLVVPQFGASATPTPADAPRSDEAPQSVNPPPEGIFNPTTLLFALGSLVAAALVAAAFLIVREVRRRRRVDTSSVGVSTLPSDQADVTRQDGSIVAPALVRGIERALTVLDKQVDPQNAIIEAWLGLQQSAEDSGVSVQASETPTEFTVRVLARERRIDAELSSLLGLYQGVRFGDRQVTASDIDTARSSLRTIQEVWS